MPQRIRLADWSRTGCYTCKRRHKKCDGQKPRCLACTRLNLTCTPSDVFCAVSVDKAPATSRKRASASEATSSDTQGPLTVAKRESVDETPLFEIAYYGRQRSCPGGKESQSLTVATKAPNYGPTDLAIDEPLPGGTLFHYYTQTLSGLLVNAIGNENPLCSLIVPRVMSSPQLLQAVCAVSSLHRSSHAEGDERTKYLSAATGYYIRAMSNLRDLIPQVSLQQNGTIPNDTGQLEIALLSCIFLCKYEIIKDGVHDWRRHLQGIEVLTQLLGSKAPASSIPDILRFSQSFITYHKGIASFTEQGTASVVELNEGFQSTNDTSVPEAPGASGGLLEVDPYMGFSRGWIELLRRVMGLMGCKFENGHALSQVKVQVESILDVISRKNWTADRFLLPRGMTPEAVRRLEHISRAYENAVHACLHSMIDELSAREGTLEEWEALRRMLPVSKEAALTGCLEEIDQVPCDCPEEAGLLPMLFIVACETDSPAQVNAAMQRIAVLEAHIGLGNVRYAAKLLREVWARRMRRPEWHSWRGLLASYNWDLIIT